MRITVNLRLRNSQKRKDGTCAVYARCTMEGTRIELSTGIFVADENWDPDGQMVRGRTEKIRTLNSRLDKFVSKIYDASNQLEATKENFSLLDLKDKLFPNRSKTSFLNIFDKVIQSIENKLEHGYAYGTLKHYRTTRKRLGEFIQKYYGRKDIALESINYDFLNSFDSFLKLKYGASSNTVWGYHRHLKKVLNDAIAMGLIQRNPYASYKVKRVEGNRDFLTMKELKKIEQKRFSAQRLELVKDLFVFACYTGLSYSDIYKLSYQHIQIGNDGENWIIIDRSKNKSRCRIPLLPSAKKIIQKYSNHPVSCQRGTVLPIHSNQKMNVYLKEIADVCGISKNLSMHVARHTFATSVTLSNGVPIETVSKMLGHSSLKTTQIYARIVDDKISDDMKKLREKIC